MCLENKNNCTGCGACYNVCPKDAITMKGDEYGFYKPVINKEKCINCGLCEKICPMKGYKSNNENEPKAFAFMNNDEIRAKSSSGGAFSAFASDYIKQNGTVYGVVWDDNIKAIHYRAVKESEIEKMHGSKYVQSDTKNTFKQVKEDLENGKLVLFSGTPCQVAGLKSYLHKDYENLLTIDLVCHGAQTPLFLEKYIKEFLNNRKDEKILNINFRSKKSPWGTGYFTTTTTTTNGVYHSVKDYYTLFMNLTLNECCLSCQYTGIPRVADITIGDFWGVEDYNKSLNDGKGTSIIIINSNRGQKIFNNIKNQYKIAEVPFNFVVKKNPNILKPTLTDPKRKEFLEQLKNDNINFKKLIKTYTHVPLYIAAYRMLPQFVKDFIKYKILKREKC